ncbi:MAG: DUF1490 family protein [Deltaproteobacteria bacterium]|jgi:hypothetical protein|nr:DUF1490 family protein [Deltaproteobacteria bacterium]
MNKWKWIMLGVGFVAGTVITTLVSGKPSPLRVGATTLLSHGIAAKRKVETLAEIAKENISDIVAEADQKAQDRQSAPADSEA